jgi:hypothetical protein
MGSFGDGKFAARAVDDEQGHWLRNCLVCIDQVGGISTVSTHHHSQGQAIRADSKCQVWHTGTYHML